MSLKRLPKDIQSLLCASAQINSFNRAVEELVYNSLDANSTSIAIRIHIQENTIQVIDNGNGITKHDFNAVGQRYMTSKLVDISTLKAAPKNYGYRGEFLANIITVSQMVKITSRHDSTEETWAKTFYNGKEKKFTKMSTRPTKGTTVDIKGFIYNLNIQRKRIDPMNEIQNIKIFLELLSLVHNNISLSLRDDSKNDIVFKIHKKRDIYQTLSTLFDIDKADVLELQVEKNVYKVKAFIKKADKDFDMHWIYVNGKFMHSSSKLHKIVNEYFRKSLLIRDHKKLKLKSKINNDENQLFNQNIPFYFIFVTCPYIDYDTSLTATQSVIIEFKNWDQMNKLLEKLVKFYVGDVNLKELKEPESKVMNKEKINIKCDQDTRDQVKKIIDKILGSNSKKLGVLQLQNGVKGKMVKRNIKKNNVKKSTLLCHNNNKITFKNNALPKSNIDPILERYTEKHRQTKGVNIDEPVNLKISKHLKSSDPKQNKRNEKPKQNKKEFKYKIISQTSKMRVTPANQKHKNKHLNINKHKYRNLKNNEPKMFKYLKNTDSVYKRSKIVAQKAEALLKKTRKRKADMTSAQNAYKKITRNSMLHKNNDFAIDNNHMPMPLKKNNNIIEEYIMNKLKSKSLCKTTYDLIQTIQISQQEINAEKKNMVDYRPKQSEAHAQKTSTWENKYAFSEYFDICRKYKMSQYTNSIPINYKTHECEDNVCEYFNGYEHKEISDCMPSFSKTSVFLQNNISSQNVNCREASYHKLNGPLTYNSHQYYINEVFESHDNSKSCAMNKRQNVRFITKQSRDNFVHSRDLIDKFKRSSKSIINKQSNVFDNSVRRTTDKSSYTIEYSNSNETYYSMAQSNILDSSVSRKENDFIKNETNIRYKNEIFVNEPKSVLRNTYTMQSSNYSPIINNITQNQTKIQYVKSRELFDTYSINYSNSEVNNNIISKTLTEGEAKENFNIVFVSKPMCIETESTPVDNNIVPLNVCETILEESGTVGRQFTFGWNENKILSNSLYDNYLNINGTNEPIGNGPFQMTSHQGNENITENISHHFSLSINKHRNVVDDIINDNLQNSMPIKNDKDNTNAFNRTEDSPPTHIKDNVNIDNIGCNVEINNFNIKNRLRFVPKGMSQIFENCRSKTACDYNLDTDYYEDSIYNNFANDVQVNAEIYEPLIQNVEDLTTKNIHKFQNKVKKDNASLVFNESSLKEAKVLGQADCKFIAAIMKTRFHESGEDIEYLVLFDQHAVHERIRLEKNLKDYIFEDKWNSVSLDNIILTMSKDEILYLHNYKDKFSQLGIQWTILKDNEVTVNSIPAAILGKNSREVEKVIKAVRNLIVEEINIIKLQKGCVSLYPKSIMDLVFSESCRYAIKFGDHLSKNDCVELLNELSNCKTPFQCAHGRPVMAVIMDIKCDKREYKINVAKLKRFKPKMN